MDYQLLTIGDVTLDAFIAPIESETYCSLDSKESFICFSFGDKIPVKNLTMSVGGNAANNSVGATRLGVKTGIVTTLGGDSIGQLALNKLKNEGVDLTYAIVQEQAGSNYSTIITAAGERTIFSYHAPRSYEFPVALPAAPWIYLTSMGESFRPFYNHFIDWLGSHRDIKLAFNPGSYQLRNLDAIEEVWPFVYVAYVNRQEAEKITGYEGSDVKDLLRALASKGPKISIITAGVDGSFVFDGERFLKASVLPVDAYERTGAGDAFGSACLSALIKGKPLEEALLWGTVNSASVIGYTGAQNGLLKESDLPVWIERANSSGAKVEEF